MQKSIPGNKSGNKSVARDAPYISPTSVSADISQFLTYPYFFIGASLFVAYEYTIQHDRLIAQKFSQTLNIFYFANFVFP